MTLEKLLNAIHSVIDDRCNTSTCVVYFNGKPITIEKRSNLFDSNVPEALYIRHVRDAEKVMTVANIFSMTDISELEKKSIHAVAFMYHDIKDIIIPDSSLVQYKKIRMVSFPDISHCIDIVSTDIKLPDM